MLFKVKTSSIDVSIESEEKYVFISGFSGAGKSLFISEVERIVEVGNDAENLIESDLKYYIINNKTMLDTIEGLIESSKKPILFLADEFLAAKVTMAIANKNACCICVTRKPPKNINYSYKCLYQANRDDRGVTVIRQKELFEHINSNIKYDIILTEDSKAGYEYLSKTLDNIEIISALGKSNIKNKLMKLENKNTIIFADAAGIGSNIGSIIKESLRIKKKGYAAHFVLPECFEQLLVESEMLNKYEKKKFNYCYNNLETFYEMELSRLTKGTILEYNHKSQKLSKCWYEQCNRCDKKCVFRNNGDKIKMVLGNNEKTKCLLELRKEFAND